MTFYNIPAGVPFVECLADGILEAFGKNPEILAKTRIYLPSKQAIRPLKAAFIKKSAGKLTFLPMISALGDSEAAEISLLNENENMAHSLLRQYRVLDSGARKLALTKLILEHIHLQNTGKNTGQDISQNTDMSYPEALALSTSLMDLLNELQSERISKDQILNLDVGFHKAAWQKSTKIIEMITDIWPVFLQKNKLTDPALYRNAVLETLTTLWKKSPPDGPVIIAGSVGYMPAIRDFIKMVSNLADGYIILPGFDPDMAKENWDILTADHPQYGLCQLLHYCDIAAEKIQNWHGVSPLLSAKHIAKRRFFHEVMRPSRSSEAWQNMQQRFDHQDMFTALDGLKMIQADTEQMEAASIALIMREALETPHKTVLLITPNQMLVRRIKAELLRWNIVPDDSAGTSLGDMPQGVFVKLLCDIFQKGISSINLLSLLKHPFVFMGIEAGFFKRDLLTLEDFLLRGSRPPQGLSGLKAHLDYKIKSVENKQTSTSSAQKRKQNHLEKLHQIGQTLSLIEEKLSPLLSLGENTTMDKFMGAFLETLQNITTNEAGMGYFFAKDAGRAIQNLCEGFTTNSQLLGVIPTDSLWQHLCDCLGSITLRPSYAAEKRLSISSTTDGFIGRKDIIILGGLTEGSWPSLPSAGIWLSRNMRHDIGLPPLERSIGLSAHDFIQAVCSPRVYVTYCKKSDCAPLIPSRWIMRLENIIKGNFDMGDKDGFLQKLKKTDYLQWAQQLDSADQPQADIKRPMPTPPISVRPNKLSVTEIETWIRDPYAIYAKHILRLRAKQEIEQDMTPAEKGSIIHDIAEDFMRSEGEKVTPDSLVVFHRLIDEYLLGFAHHPAALGFWRPRLMRIAKEFVHQEIKNQQSRRPIALEASGDVTFKISDQRDFTLTARLDRLDKKTDGNMIIMDYKTSKGSAKSVSQIESGLAPQLPLQAMMIQMNGFNGVQNSTVDSAEYIILSGASNEPYLRLNITPKKNSKFTDFSEIIQETHTGFLHWVERFEDVKTPYTSRLMPQFMKYMSDYDHLARVKQWYFLEGEGDSS